MEPTTTASDSQTISALRTELTRINQEIEIAKVEDAQYTGGLVKSLITVRLQIIQITRALLEQRICSLEFGVPFSIVAQAATPDHDRATLLGSDIQSQSTLIKKAKAEASKYVGGLIHATWLTTIATCEHTLATLRQQQLVAKYGLVFPSDSTIDQNIKDEFPKVAPQAYPLLP
ncbi:MAG: hypothetical protein WCR46_00080 [Deltaproteobacteria bacterium]